MAEAIRKVLKQTCHGTARGLRICSNKILTFYLKIHRQHIDFFNKNRVNGEASFQNIFEVKYCQHVNEHWGSKLAACSFHILYDTAECASTKFKSPPCPRKADGPDSEFSQDHRTCLGSAWSTLVHAPELREVCRCIAVIGITPGILMLKYHIIIYP